MAWGQPKPEHPHLQQEWCGKGEPALPEEGMYACNSQGEGVPITLLMGAYGCGHACVSVCVCVCMCLCV